MSPRATYLDASALVKLVVREAQSESLAEYLAGRTLASSRISIVEVARAVGRRFGRTWEPEAEVFDELAFIELDSVVTAAAATLKPTELRSLDAIHLASAGQLGSDLEAFVTYDSRLAAAAQSLGIPIVAPGLST